MAGEFVRCPLGQLMDERGYIRGPFGSALVRRELKQSSVPVYERLRNSTSVDWQKRESVRARLRNLVRITLRRCKYPPDMQEEAIRLVLEQADRLSDEWTR